MNWLLCDPKGNLELKSTSVSSQMADNLSFGKKQAKTSTFFICEDYITFSYVSMFIIGDIDQMYKWLRKLNQCII